MVFLRPYVLRMEEAKLSRSWALDLVGGRRGEPPFNRYEGTAERGFGCKGLEEEMWSSVGEILGGC